MPPGATSASPMFAEDIIKHTTCINEETYKQTVGDITKNCKWKSTIPATLSFDEYKLMQCDEGQKPGLKAILPRLDGIRDVVYYHSCKGNLYNALKRQAIDVTDPCPEMMKDFYNWFEVVFQNEIRPLLEDFTYSYEDWFNHLTAAQQHEVQHLPLEDPSKLFKKEYTMFCKCEKQIIEDKYPKNRCICAPNAEYKYVMGPIIYRLEAIFKQFFGYGVGKNWTEKESMYNEWGKRLLTRIVQGDGSGFDRSQKVIHKMVDKMIYHFIAPYVHHVPEEVFLYHVNTDKVRIYATLVNKTTKYRDLISLGFIEMSDAVRSGDMDTTFANTLRMVLYNRYTIERVLQVPRDDYGLTCAGDDFAAALPLTVSEEEISRAYYTTFSKATTGTHGLGQILKYLKFGGIDSIDFCSTETFWSEAQQSWKIIRQIPRFLTLTPWSHSALAMSSQEQSNYMHDQYYSNLRWMKDLPILTEWNDLLKRNEYFKLPIKKGATKTYLPVPKQYQPINTIKSVNELWLESKGFSRDQIYARKDRVTDKANCADDFVLYLNREYGLSPDDITQIQQELRQQHNGVTIYSSRLVEACEFKKMNNRLTSDY
jgi:hypothetical protein